ncbi:MAG: VWA domain-containing protein, partial [Planctomycetota bacterium]
PTADHLAGNNRVQATAWPAGVRRVTVIAPEPLGSALTETLSKLPDTAAVASPPEATEVVPAEDPDVVVLAGTSFDRLPTPLVARLVDEVNHRGTGLLALGGPRSFAIGGYTDTPIEHLLPVRCDPPGKRLALGLVLDASSSMASPPGASRFDTARTAAVAVAGRLNRRDRLALVTFADRPTVLLRPRGAPSDRRVAEVLSQVKPYGATDLVAALGQAAELIRTVDLPGRHLLVLSDGRSSTTDIDTLLARLRQDSISVSVVASGDDHNRELLKKLTDSTGGTFHRPRSIDRLQRTFLEDLRRRRGTLLDTRTLEAQVVPGPGRPASSLPTVTGLNPLDPRRDATVWARIDDGRPVLVVGPHGLGRSAALAVDPLAPGNRALWQSPRFVDLFAETLGWLSARPTDSGWHVTFRRLDRGLSITAHSPQPDEQPAALQAEVIGDGGRRTIEVPPVSPGRYHGEVDLSTGTTATVILRRTDGPVLYRGTVSATPPETTSWTVDHTELARWAETTGGRVIPPYRPGEVLSSRHRVTRYRLRPGALLLLVGSLVIEAVLTVRVARG